MTLTMQDVPRAIEEVKRQLAAKEDEKHLGLTLHEREYRLEDEWLYLLVTSIRPGIHADEYAQALDEVEQQLRREGFDHVLLLPMLEE
jgi:hypothetical protein